MSEVSDPHRGKPGGSGLDYALSTYRALRISMVLLLLTLAASVLIEHFHTSPRCFQTSISAYYYTPARAIFVGVLAAIGVCMIALKGSTSWETVLLNNGGIAAAVVSMVPTASVSGCFSTTRALPDISADVANNIPAVFVAGTLGLIATVFLSAHDLRHARGFATLPALVGFAATAVELFGAFSWFLIDRASFMAHAHDTAAIVLFSWIVAVALDNAYGFGLQGFGAPRPATVSGISEIYRNRYTVIAILMVLSPLVLWVASLLISWPQWLLWTETTMLGLFGAFWILQTHELWNSGVRPSTPVLGRR